MTQPILNLEDKRTPTWCKVKTWAETELQQLRINLEADQDQSRTEKLRGQIKFCKALLDLENEQHPISEDE